MTKKGFQREQKQNLTLEINSCSERNSYTVTHCFGTVRCLHEIQTIAIVGSRSLLRNAIIGNDVFSQVCEKVD